MRALRSPAPDGNMQPWLERIFHNLLVDTWRRQPPASVPLDEEILTAGQSPEEAVLQHERRQAVRAHLAQLPREARQALLSRYYGELEPAAAAARLGVAPATVRTRIHRGLSRLRVVLADLRALVPPGIANLWTAKSSALAMAPVLVVALAGGGDPSSSARAGGRGCCPGRASGGRARPMLAQASPTRAQSPAPVTVEPKPRTRTTHAQPTVAAQPDPSSVPTKVFRFRG